MTPTASPRLEPLLGGDGLRGLASLMVFTAHMAIAGAAAHHSGGLVPAFGPIGALIIHFDLAVYVFFVLSGYLIGRPLVRALMDGRPLPSLRRYARRRVLRIVPVFWGLSTIIIARHVLFPDAFPRGSFLAHARRIPAIYAFMQTYFRSPAANLMGPGWSLHVEIGFYALLPLAAIGLARQLRGRRPPLSAVLVVLAAVFLVSLFCRALTPDTLEWRRSIPDNLFAFVPGLVLAAVEPYLAPRMSGLRRGRALALALVSLGGVVIIGNALVPNSGPTLADGNWWRGLTRALGSGAVVTGILVVQWTTGSCWPALAAGPLHWLGVRSYSFYLIQQPLLLELVGVLNGHNQWLATAILTSLVLPASLVLAHLSYLCFERPFIGARERVAVRATARVPG